MSEKKNKSLRRQEDVRLLDEEVFEEFEDEEDFSESDNFSADDSFDDDDIDDDELYEDEDEEGKKKKKKENWFPKSHKEEAKEEVSGTFQLTETCRSEMLSTPRQIPCWISVLSKASAPWKYIPDVHDTITAIIRASTERQNSAAGTIQVLTYLLRNGKKFLTILAQMTSAGRLEYHICDADFAGGFGCRHFFCGRHLSKRKKYFKSVTFY